VKPYYANGGIVIYHGDCLSVTAWLVANVLVTDPPYGMAFQSSRTTERRPVVNDHDATTRDKALALWGDKPAILFGTWRVARPAGTRQVITWIKASAGPGMGDLGLPWGCATEEIYVLGAGWSGRRRPNYITTSEQRGNPHGAAALLGHPTPKPTPLMESLIDCAPPGIIADPFMGVGATLLAAKSAGRHAIGIEVEERYCEIAAKQLGQAVLDFTP